MNPSKPSNTIHPLIPPTNSSSNFNPSNQTGQFFSSPFPSNHLLSNYSSNSEQGTNKKKRKVPTISNHHNNLTPYRIITTSPSHHKLSTSQPTPSDPLQSTISSSDQNLFHSITPPIPTPIHPPLQDPKTHRSTPFQFHLIHQDPKSPSTFPDTLIDPLALARLLSSHHVRTKMKPISSPRHHGRHLHKLTLSRTLDCQPNPDHSTTAAFSISPPKPSTSPLTKSTPTTSKLGKKKLTPSPQRPQPKRISKRQAPSSLNSKHKSLSALIKSRNNQVLTLPILPNLYDPSLKIDQIPANPTSQFSASISSSSTQILPSQTSDHLWTLECNNKSQLPEKGITLPDGYNGKFTFTMEMAAINQRLAGLHLAISADKRNRVVQIQEAMKIAMEKVDRSSISGPFGESDQIARFQSSDYHSLGNREDDHFLELGLDSSSNIRTASDPLNTTSTNCPSNQNSHHTLDPASSVNPSERKSHSLLPTDDPDTGFSHDHGPSGPPPSEPPPPLPHQQAIKTRKKLANAVSSPAQNPSTTTDTEDNHNNRLQPPKKNQQQKGKKKRSAHANANNIHHRDNYIPSRLPNRYQFNSFSGSSSDLLNNSLVKNPSNRNEKDWSAFDFLTQDQFEDSSGGSNEFVFIDPNLSLLLSPVATASGHSSKSMKKTPKSEQESIKKPVGQHCQLGRSPISRFFVEPDEWICGFCEYQLWFGDEISLIKVIKNRKEVLRRRRRAKERAANGVNMKNVSNTQSSSVNNTNNNTNKNSANNIKSTTDLIGDHHPNQKNKHKKLARVRGKHHDDDDDDDNQDQYSKSSDDRFDDQVSNNQLVDEQEREDDDVNDLLPKPSVLFNLPSPTHVSPPLPSSSSVAAPVVADNNGKE